MQIFTSHYAKINKIRDILPDYTLVSISGWISDEIKNLLIYTIKDWHPVGIYLRNTKNKKNQDRYVQRFKTEILANINLDEIIKSWNSNKFVLLCYESNNPCSDTFCHRRIVAKTLSQKYKTKELFLDYSHYKIKDYSIYAKHELNDQW